jgi:acyl carrier protein
MEKKQLEFDEFKKVLSDILGISIEEIKFESVIYQDIGIDSLGLVNLGTKIQKIYDIEIPPAIIVDVKTIGDLYDCVKSVIES